MGKHTKNNTVGSKKGCKIKKIVFGDSTKHIKTNNKGRKLN